MRASEALTYEPAACWRRLQDLILIQVRPAKLGRQDGPTSMLVTPLQESLIRRAALGLFLADSYRVIRYRHPAMWHQPSRRTLPGSRTESLGYPPMIIFRLP